jgi:diacylglycerol kinase family enzyme
MDGKGRVFSSLSAVLRRSFRSVRATADGIALDTGSVLFLTLANGKFAADGVFCAPLASLDDGKLDLCIVRNMPPMRLAKVLPLLASGALADEPSLAGDLILRQVKSLSLESAKDMTLMLDGRPLTGKQFNIKVVPVAVRLRIPAV